MKVVLISTYELGRQPFGLASPAAWLERSGAQVTCFDLAVETLEEEAVAVADVVVFYVPMHTATRLAIEAFKRIRALNPGAHYCFYGLYAPMNEQFLRKLGAQSIIGGEFEAPLVALVDRLVQGGEVRAKSVVSPPRISHDLRFRFLRISTISRCMHRFRIGGAYLSSGLESQVCVMGFDLPQRLDCLAEVT